MSVDSVTLSAPAVVVTAGIDVAKATLDIALHPTGARWQVTRDAKGIAEMIGRLHPAAPRIVVLEATGGLERPVVAALSAAGVPFAVVNPRRARQFARASGREAKTDAVDAAALAHLGAALTPAPQAAPDPARAHLAALVARRRQLVEMRVMERQRRADAPAAVRAGIDEHLAWLTERVRAAEHDIRAALAADAALGARAALLQSVPGVGLITAATLVADLPELGTLDRKPLAALVGVAPFAHDSGRLRGTRRCRGGRAHVRAALYLAALTAVRVDPGLHARHAALLARGKPPKVARVACAHALLRILAAIARTGVPWRSAPSRPDGS